MAFNLPRASAVRDTLRRQLPELDAAMRGRVVGALADNGHIVDDLSPGAMYAGDRSTLTGQLSAADSLKVDAKRKPSLDRIMATLRRFGYDARENEIVDRFKLDQVLAKSNDITGRLALKAEMRQLNLLPRVS